MAGIAHRQFSGRLYGGVLYAPSLFRNSATGAARRLGVFSWEALGYFTPGMTETIAFAPGLETAGEFAPGLVAAQSYNTGPEDVRD